MQYGADVHEIAVLVGLPASGKSSFYRQRLSATHALVSKDNWPNARHRERRQLRLVAQLLAACRNVAVDNTNASPAERAGVIAQARVHGATIVGYWFPPDVAGSRARNATREGRARVPDVAIYATAKRLAPPSHSEGFDTLYEVHFDGTGGFVVTAMESPSE